MNNDIFQVVMMEQFKPLDTLSIGTDKEFVVTSVKEVVAGYVYGLVVLETFLHQRFLCKYSQFLWGFN